MPRGSKGVIIHSKLKCFKINPALWEMFRVKYKGKTAARLRQLITEDLKSDKLWIEIQKLLTELGLKTTKNELVEILLEAWIRKTKRNLETGEA